MVSDRASSAGYGYGGGKSGSYGSSKGSSASSKGSGGQSKGPGKSAKGSPRTKSIGSLADYEKKRTAPKAFDYVPSAVNKAVTGKFFASEPEYRQMRDIKDAYKGYRPSPPQGALRGLKNSEVSRGISGKSSGYRGGHS